MSNSPGAVLDPGPMRFFMTVDDSSAPNFQTALQSGPFFVCSAMFDDSGALNRQSAKKTSILDRSQTLVRYLFVLPF